MNGLLDTVGTTLAVGAWAILTVGLWVQLARGGPYKGAHRATADRILALAEFQHAVESGTRDSSWPAPAHGPFTAGILVPVAGQVPVRVHDCGWCRDGDDVGYSPRHCRCGRFLPARPLAARAPAGRCVTP